MTKKIFSYIKNPSKIIIYLSRKIEIISKIFPDRLYLKLAFKAELGYWMDIDNATTFNEKIQWLKLYDRKPEYTKMVDKYSVRKYIAEKLGDEYLIPLIGVYNNFYDIDFDKLPNKFVLKCTHDSGGVIICKDKKNFNIEKTKRIINKKTKRNFYYVNREWPYKKVKPRIIIEKYLFEEYKEEEIYDYKIMCFNGKALCSFVCSNRNSIDGLNVNFYDLEWNEMNFERQYMRLDKEISKPLTYEKMIEAAEKLSEGIPFVRIDFYEANNKMYFGEITLYPGAGFEKFNPDLYDKLLGDWITLPYR